MESNNKWLILVEEANSKMPNKTFNLKEILVALNKLKVDTSISGYVEVSKEKVNSLFITEKAKKFIYEYDSYVLSLSVDLVYPTDENGKKEFHMTPDKYFDFKLLGYMNKKAMKTLKRPKHYICIQGFPETELFKLKQEIEAVVVDYINAHVERD